MPGRSPLPPGPPHHDREPSVTRPGRKQRRYGTRLDVLPHCAEKRPPVRIADHVFRDVSGAAIGDAFHLEAVALDEGRKLSDIVDVHVYAQLDARVEVLVAHPRVA